MIKDKIYYLHFKYYCYVTIYTHSSWTELRRLCSNYLEEQEPEKMQERQRVDEQRVEQKKAAKTIL